MNAAAIPEAKARKSQVAQSPVLNVTATHVCIEKKAHSAAMDSNRLPAIGGGEL